MTLFVDRLPDARDMQRLQLLLSTFQDGSGMLEGGHAPGWRDFERAVASWLGGEASESKHIYDVHVRPAGRSLLSGFSCKMRGTLKDTRRKGDATIEVSNSAKKLWSSLKTAGITEENLSSNNAVLAGRTIIATAAAWHHEVSSEGGGPFDAENSPMLHLAYDPGTARQRLAGQQTEYQLFAFRHHLPGEDEAAALRWYVTGNRLLGLRPDGSRGVEWYFGSGGQLKAYPKVVSAFWTSDPFNLEPLRRDADIDVLTAKALAYFPASWAAATGLSARAAEELGDSLKGPAER